MAQKPLDSDELGRKGEFRFEELCTDAKLVPNRVNVDRKGWDAIVEWRQPEEATDYDDRAPTIAARVQVKTVWEGGTSIRLRLSSAEALAKDHRPSFIYVAVIDTELKLTGAHIIHVRGSFLRDILVQLRKARLNAKRSNKVPFAVTLARVATKVAPEGEAFKEFVECAVGSSMFDYAASKQDELESEKGAMRFETRLAIDTEDHFDGMAEFFLGRREAKVVDLAAFSTRFGIDLRDENLSGQSGTMRITPQSSTKCVLSLRLSNGQNLRFKGDLYRTPRLITSPPRGRIIVRTAAFNLTLDGVVDFSSTTQSADISLESAGRDAKLTTDGWADVCLFFAEVGLESTTLEIRPDDVAVPLTSAAVKMDYQHATMRRNWQLLAQVSQQAAIILRHAGLQEWQLTLAVLRAECNKISILHAMINDPSNVSTMSYDVMEGVSADQWPEYMLYFDRLEFGENALAYTAKMRFSPDTNGATVTATFDSILRLEGIDRSDESFFEFVETTRTTSEIDSYYIADRTEK